MNAVINKTSFPAYLNDGHFVEIGKFILVTRGAKLLAVGSQFDISWFIPAFMKGHGIIGKILIASLFL